MSQALLIDSDIMIDHLRKEQSALNYIQQEIDDGSPLFISVISRIEILSGARKGEDETIRSLFDIMTWWGLRMTTKNDKKIIIIFQKKGGNRS